MLVAWLLQKQATVALAKLTGEVSDADRAFYTGKVAAAQFFAREVLPRVRADRKILVSRRPGPHGSAGGRVLALVHP